jgi:hypothetical protein
MYKKKLINQARDIRWKLFAINGAGGEDEYIKDADDCMNQFINELKSQWLEELALEAQRISKGCLDDDLTLSQRKRLDKIGATIHENELLDLPRVAFNINHIRQVLFKNNVPEKYLAI